MDEATSRATRRESQRHVARRRTRIVVAVVVGLLVVAGAAVAVLALGGGSDGSGSHGASGTTTAKAATSVDLQVGDIASDSAGPAVAFTAAQAQQVLTVIGTYLDRAVVAPLRTGQVGDLATVFDAGTLARVIGADQAVMTESGLPKVSGDLTVTAKPVGFVALGDQSGALVLVAASVDLTVDGKVADARSPLHVAQTGDLVLAPDATGAWKVTSYSMSVTRSGGGVDTTTSSTPVTTKAAR